MQLRQLLPKDLVHVLPIDHVLHPSLFTQTFEVLLATSFICILSPIDLTVGKNKRLPISLQSLIVLLVPSVLGSTRGCISVLVYLFAGSILELPVFARGTSGRDKLSGPSGGFLWSFILAAFWIGQCFESNHDSILLKEWIICFLFGHFIILAVGLLWLGYFQRNSIPSFPSLVLELLVPLLPGLCIKTIAGAFIANCCNRHLLDITSDNTMKGTI